MSKSAKDREGGKMAISWQGQQGLKRTCRPEEFPPLVDLPTANLEPALNLAPATCQIFNNQKSLSREKYITYISFLKSPQNSFDACLSTLV